MPVPKRKTSRTKRNKRRAHDALVAPQWIACSHCGEPTLPHRICPHCGYYRGKQFIEAKEG